MRTQTLQSIVENLMEAPNLSDHAKRTSELCVQMGEVLSFDLKQLDRLRNAGLLHDIGKMADDQQIVRKPSHLTPEEKLELRRHSELGYRILSLNNEFSPIAEYILLHHEHWDGSGYPKGIFGKDIPLIARIIALTNTYDSLTRNLPYRARAFQAGRAGQNCKRFRAKIRPRTG
jgi:putative nucleotidyltransferase with HDIG domain